MTEAVQFKINYLKSIHGILKLKQIILGFIACILIGYFCETVYNVTACIGVGDLYGIESFGGQGFVLAVLSISIIINCVQFVVHFFNLNNVWSNINWRKTQMIYAAIFCVLLLICCGLETYYCIRIEYLEALWDGNKVYARWLVGAIFVLIMSVSFGVEAFLFQSGRIES